MLDDTTVSNEEQETSEEPELDLELEDTQDIEETKAEVSEDVNALKAQLAELEHKNKQLYARLKKEPEKAEKKPSYSQPNEDSDWKQKIEFVTTKGRNLDAEDIDEVIAYAKGKGISYEEALNSTVIKAHLKVKQAREKIANAIPSSSPSAVKVNGKTWSEMNDQERAKNFDKMMKKRA